MRLLTDQDVYQFTVEFLRSLGHDVLRAKDVGLSSASDVALLDWARTEGRVLVTRDKGYGLITFLERREHGGIFLLRGNPATIQAVHDEFRRFFAEHPTIEMQSRLVVVEPGRHRIRATKG
ncbi:MAG: DUF5615 family PIN-like protein [Candidatus Methylomirabilales bacterium]